MVTILVGRALFGEHRGKDNHVTIHGVKRCVTGFNCLGAQKAFDIASENKWAADTWYDGNVEQ